MDDIEANMRRTGESTGNAVRIARGHQAMKAWKNAAGEAGDLCESTAVDTITDILHWMQSKGLEVEVKHASALNHFQCEQD